MTIKKRAFAALALAVVVALFGSQFGSRGARGQNPNVETPGSARGAAQSVRYVLTRTGAICEGALVDRGESYLVQFPSGGSIAVSKLDVALIAENRDEIYRYKANEARLEDVNEAIRLADWARRSGFANEAIQTLESIMSGTIDAAERNALSKKVEELKVAEKFRADAERVKASRDAKASASATTYKSALDNPEDRELDEWGRSLPPATLERFARRISPIMQKRCAVSGCHDMETPGARYVLRPKAIGAAQRLAMLYNLRETARYIDFENVEESAALRHPTVVDYNGERRYPFGADRNSERDCEAFIAWVNGCKSETKLAKLAEVDRRNRPIEPRNTDASPSRYARQNDPENGASAPASGGDGGAEGAFANLFEEPNAPATPALDRAEGRTNANDGFVFQQGVSPDAERFAPNPYDDVNSPESALRRVGLAPQKTYRDDFDPAIFNDRYHPNKK